MTPDKIAEDAKQAGLPSTIALPTCSVEGEDIDSAPRARCFAEYMRIHALESTGGLTYSELGRYASEDGDPKGTNDFAAAATDDAGKPLSNPGRDTWVTATALSTALNVSFMAYNLALFGVVVGIALLLSGIGFIILAILALGRTGRARTEGDAKAAAQPAAPAIELSSPTETSRDIEKGRRGRPFFVRRASAAERQRERISVESRVRPAGTPRSAADWRRRAPRRTASRSPPERRWGTAAA